MKYVSLLFASVLAVHGRSLGEKVLASCGYDACPAHDPNAINVHIVPHSHDDVGWLKTVNQYYDDEVRHILDTVIEALKEKPERRFIQVEVAFFKMWWEQQNDKIKQDVIDLVNNGQLEMVNGAWSMNDEAASYYSSTIDQFTLGLRYLKDNLGPCARPRAGWQIDSFGHSREHASINAQIGYDSLFLARIDYRDIDNRKAKKTQDMLWRATANLGNTSDVFTSVLFNNYSCPPGFCFDARCTDAETYEDGNSNYNYEKLIKDFIHQIQERADAYPINNILVTMGDYFQYTNAHENFDNLDTLINGFKVFPQKVNGMPIKLYYSTPSCYAKAVHEYLEKNSKKLEIKTDDFFPYANGPNTYWTGYYTSRPASKRFERQSSNLLQIVKQLGAAAGVPYSNAAITSLKEALGIMQHHEAITGTAKQYVTNDFHLLLSQGVANANKEVDEIIRQLAGKESVAQPLEFTSCLLANVSFCPQTNSDKFSVLVYNPLSRIVSSPVEIPVDTENWIILDPEEETVPHQVYSAVRDFSYITEGKPSPHVLEFMAVDLPPLGFKIYTIEKPTTATKRSLEVGERIPENPSPSSNADEKIVRINFPGKREVRRSSLAIGYNNTKVHFDQDGNIRLITMNSVALGIFQNFFYYTSANGSGAYIFKPTDNEPKIIGEKGPKITRLSGEVFDGVVQQFNEWTTQTIKIYKDDPTFVEFDWIIGPINVSDGIGKEVITRFKTPLITKGVFYTDANGREMIARKLNHRETYEYTNEEEVAGNYYPVNSRIAIRDDYRQTSFAIITDRSHGGTSLKNVHNGQIEIMLHRACLQDDGKGVGENLNEQQYGQGIVVRGRYYVVLGLYTANGEGSIKALEKDVVLRKTSEPWTFITKTDASKSLTRLQWSNLKKPLPDNVHILTLEPWNENEVLLRLEHVLESDDDETLSTEVTVDVSNIFQTFTITKLEETGLAGDMPLKVQNRLQWSTDEEFADKPEVLSVQNRRKRAADDLTITLAPMQIRTFVATVKYVR